MPGSLKLALLARGLRVFKDFLIAFPADAKVCEIAFLLFSFAVRAGQYLLNLHRQRADYCKICIFKIGLLSFFINISYRHDCKKKGGYLKQSVNLFKVLVNYGRTQRHCFLKTVQILRRFLPKENLFAEVVCDCYFQESVAANVSTYAVFVEIQYKNCIAVFYSCNMFINKCFF